MLRLLSVLLSPELRSTKAAACFTERSQVFYRINVKKNISLGVAPTTTSESSLVSNNMKFQIVQKCSQDVQLFPTNPIKCLNAYADR